MATSTSSKSLFPTLNSTKPYLNLRTKENANTIKMKNKKTKLVFEMKPVFIPLDPRFKSFTSVDFIPIPKLVNSNSIFSVLTSYFNKIKNKKIKKARKK